MRLSIFGTMALCLGLALSPGCSEEETPSGGKGGSGGGGTGGAGTGGTGTGGATGSGGSGADAAGETSSGVTWTKDVKPIFAAKCATCHTTTGIAHNLGVSYAKAKNPPLNTTACGAATTIAACTIKRIKEGSMPAIMPKCTGNPAMDVANDKCLTQAEQDIVQAWVTAGAPE